MAYFHIAQTLLYCDTYTNDITQEIMMNIQTWLLYKNWNECLSLPYKSTQSQVYICLLCQCNQTSTQILSSMLCIVLSKSDEHILI